ncbi:metallophosphoesterase [Azotosporobacter soli]|uniref:metallophosphoesterase n=1 Tax=Azotosporobacter soli TaxID=3055040 RepID=UPI0031FF3C51
MKIGVVSDSHGQRAALKVAAQALGEVDLWLHAGDCSQDASALAEVSIAPIIAVKGNCDGSVQTKADEFITLSGCRLWLTHGHRHGVKWNCDELVWWAKEYQVQGVIYGHSHLPDCHWEDGVLLLNPGSVALPRQGRASCALLEVTDEGVLTARIIEL